MIKNRKHINYRIFFDNINLDFAFFDFKIWKIAILIIGLLSLICTYLFYFQVTLKLIIMLLSLTCLIVFPTVNYVINIAGKRFLCDSILIILSALISFAFIDKTAAIIIILLFDVFKFAECYLWNSDTSMLSNALNILPDYASVASNGKAVKIKPTRLKKGDICCIYKDETIPIDGVIVNGLSVVDYCNYINHDSEVSVSKGSMVLSGGINKLNPIIIVADCDYNECFAKKVFDMCDDSLKGSTKESDTFNKCINFLIPILCFLILIVSLLIPLFTHNWSNSLLFLVISLLIMCPFGTNTLLYKYFYCSIVSLFNKGVVLSSELKLEMLSNIKTIICNKTATVTESFYTIEDVNPEGLSIDNFLSLVLKVESISKSPMADSLRKYCNIESVEIPDGLIAKEIPGKGIEAHLNNNSILIGNASLLFEHNVTMHVPDKPGSVVYVSVNNSYCGYIIFSNKIRPSSFNIIEKLIADGVQNFVLVSCDLRSIVRPIANTLGFSVTKSEIEPEDKISITDYFVNNSVGKSTVLYLGDINNEIIASKHADVSMTSDAIIDKSILNQADVISIGGGFETLPAVIRFSILCDKFSKLQLLLYIGSRLLFVLLNIICNFNILFVIISLFLISIVPLILSSLIYKGSLKSITHV